MNKWVFLSHQLNQSHFAYGNGRTISIERTNKISNGDSSNNTILNLPTHFGTHLDFPYHFDINGKKGEEYLPDYYISNKVEFIELKINPITNHLINVSDFSEYEFNPNTEILIIRTGMGDYFKHNEYWNANSGFAPELANYFKQRMPNLRIFGFDSISLTGRQFRNEGKEAHRVFLVKNNILVLEDMDLSQLVKSAVIEEIIVSPLRFQNADGAPVTVFAKVNCY